MKKNSLNIAAAMAFAAGMAHAAIVFDVKTDRPDAVYKCGEKAVFTVTAKDDKGAPLQGAFTARLDNFGPKVVATAEVDLAKDERIYAEGYLERQHTTGEYRDDCLEFLSEKGLPLSALCRLYRRAAKAEGERELSSETLLHLFSLTGEAVSGYALIKHIGLTGLLVPLSESA